MTKSQGLNFLSFIGEGFIESRGDYCQIFGQSGIKREAVLSQKTAFTAVLIARRYEFVEIISAVLIAGLSSRCARYWLWIIAGKIESL